MKRAEEEGEGREEGSVEEEKRRFGDIVKEEGVERGEAGLEEVKGVKEVKVMRWGLGSYWVHWNHK